MDDVSIFDYIFLAFQTQTSGFAALIKRFVMRNIIVKSNYLRSDKASGEVGVNCARRVDGVVSIMKRPSTHFIGAAGKEADQPKQFIGLLDQAFASGLSDVQTFGKLSRLFL